MNKTLSDRMTAYEKSFDFVLPPNQPIVVRIDGKNFRKITQECNKPFDNDFIEMMIQTTKNIVQEVDGCIFGYVESDEINLIIDCNFENAWFGNRLEKIVSVLASKATAEFNSILSERQDDKYDFMKRLKPCFDARAFVVPREDLPNYILYRVKNCYRNCVNSYGQYYVGNKESIGLSRDKLIQEINLQIDFDKVSKTKKFGTQIIKIPIGEDKTEWRVEAVDGVDDRFYYDYENYFRFGYKLKN